MTTTRISRDAYGLKLAEAAALRADCTRRQVGAVIIAADGSIVSTGYNGLASGLPGCASAGACPRGQMAYPTEAPVKVGDPDPCPSDGDCPAEKLKENGRRLYCTLTAGHSDPWHIAGDGDEVCAVWTDTPVQPAQVGYEATGCRAVHAEVNAILRGRGREGCVGATIYVTDEPCFHCSVVIEGAGIVRVVTPHSPSTVTYDSTGITVRRPNGTVEIRIGEAEARRDDFARGVVGPDVEILSPTPIRDQLRAAAERAEALPPRARPTVTREWLRDSTVDMGSMKTSGPLDPEVYAALARSQAAATLRRAELAKEHEGWRP